jgi:hypothetical protein
MIVTAHGGEYFKCLQYKEKVIPYDVSTEGISTIQFAVTAESSTRFRSSSLVQLVAKPLPTVSKLARG